MKKLLILFILFSIQAYSQNNNYIKSVESIDSTIETLYSVISGDKGVERDWNLFKYLFHKDAKLIPSRINEQGITSIFCNICVSKCLEYVILNINFINL